MVEVAPILAVSERLLSVEPLRLDVGPPLSRSATILATCVSMALERYGTWQPSRFAVEGSRRAALLGVRHDAGGLRGLESPAIKMAARGPLIIVYNP